MKTLARHPAAGLLAILTTLSLGARQGQAVSEVEPNESPAQARALGEGAVGTGAVDPAGDLDLWAVRNANVFDLVFAFAETAGLAGDLALDVRSGTAVIEADTTGGPAGRAAVAGAVVPQAGDVLLGVREAAGTATLGAYTLVQAVVPAGDSAAEVEGNESAASANALTARVTTGAVSGADTDVFSFFANAGRKIAVIVDEDPDNDGVLADIRVAILDQDATTELAASDEDPARRVAVAGLVTTAAFGTFFVRIGNGGQSPDDDYRFVVLVNGDLAFANACCMPDGSCQDVTEGACTDVGGTLQGAGSVCAVAACPQPLGACCTGDCGSCSERTAAECAAAGGRFGGAGSTCATSRCDLVVERDPAAFADAAGRLTAETFDELRGAPGTATGCGSPVAAGTFCFAQDEIPPGLRLETPDGSGISGLPGGRQALPVATTSAVMCAESFDVVLDAGARAIGAHVAGIVPVDVVVTLLGAGGTQLGTTALVTDSRGTFVGVVSDEPIERVRVSSPSGGRPCLDAVEFGGLRDGDADGVPNNFFCRARCGSGQANGCDDNCPTAPNVDQLDGDGDAVGDACDVCRLAADAAQDDTDADAIGDACDLCVEVPNPAPAEASFPVLACRLAELGAAVADDARLVALLGQADGFEALAEARCEAGITPGARRQLRRAIRKLVRVATRLRTLGPPASPLGDSADATVALARSLRSALLCPAAAAD